MMKETNTDVLIIGAGPAGVMCANALAMAGVNVRVVDKRSARTIHLMIAAAYAEIGPLRSPPDRQTVFNLGRSKCSRFAWGSLPRSGPYFLTLYRAMALENVCSEKVTKCIWL